MTPIAEKALLRRISDARNPVAELIDAVIKMEEIASAVLDELDSRIGQEYMAELTLIPYLNKHFRPQIFETLRKNRTLSDYGMAELFKAGYGGQELEQELCEILYKIFRENDNPRRRYILEALKSRGKQTSLEMLEIIQFELKPEVMVRQIVGKSLIAKQQKDGASDLRILLEVILAKSLIEFSNDVDLAVQTLHQNVAQSPNVHTPEADVADTDVSSKADKDVSLLTRAIRVDVYVKKAEHFLPDHPDESLNNMRKAVEAICKDILDLTSESAKENGQNLKPAKAYESLEDMLSQVRRRTNVSAIMGECFKSLQRFGNLGSHDQDDDPRDMTSEIAESILSQLRSVVKWYKEFSPSAPL